MTPVELALGRLKAIRLLQENAADIEADHSNADQTLCDLLRALGHDEIVNEYESIDKWYA